MRLVSLWLVLVVVGGCATSRIPHTACPTAYRPSVVAGRPFVWEVRSPYGSSITLFGTYHAAGGSDVPAVAWAALDRSKVFVAEVDEVQAGDRDRPEVRGMLHLPPSTTLEALLPHDAWLQDTISDMRS